MGAPYFNLMFTVLAPALVIFLGVGISSQWKDTRPGVLLKQVPLLAIVSVPVAFVIPLWMGEITFSAVLGMFLASWLILATLRDLQQKQGSRGWLMGWLKTTRSYKGMVLGHLGLAVVIIGATLVSNYTVEKDVRMTPGDSHALGDWVFRFEKMDHLQGPNYLSDQGHFTVETADGVAIGQLHPEKRRYMVSGNVMTEAGIMAGLWRDLYISLGEKLPGDEVWAVRLHIKPFVRWLWLGGLLMACGGALAVMDKRYRFRPRLAARQDAQDTVTREASPSVGSLQGESS